MGSEMCIRDRRRNLKDAIDMYGGDYCLDRFRCIPLEGLSRINQEDSLLIRKLNFTLAEAKLTPERAKPKIKIANGLSSPVGGISTGDLVIFGTPTDVRAGFVDKFFEVEPKTFYASVTTLNHLRGTQGSKAAADTKQMFILAELILGVFPFVVEGDVVHMLAGADIL